MALGKTTRFFLHASIAGVVAAAVLILVQPQLVAKQTPVVELITAPDIRTQHIHTGVNQGPVSYADAVQRATPAVVNINTSKTVTLQPHPFYNDPFFRQFFGDMIQAPNLSRKRVENSLGSGVVVSANGYILTNHHVIRGADEINVFFQDGRSIQAKVIGTDEETDLAVLKVDLTDLTAITLADSDNTKVGDVVLAIGNPYGVGQTVTMGIVSATGRNQLGINTFENFIQTDAAINPGNSGGALVDAHGRLIGINTAIFSRTGGSHGIGFAIPTSMAKEVMEQIIKYGHPIRGWLGFEGQQVTPKLAYALGLDKDMHGVIITGVVRNSPAHKAGLVPGDVLVAIDGNPIKRARQALTRISKHKPGDKVVLKVVRNGKTKTFTATAIVRRSVNKRRLRR